MVVPVLMTSCQVAEKLKNGPAIAHKKIHIKAQAKAGVLPAALETEPAKRSNVAAFLSEFVVITFTFKLMNKLSN